MKLPRFIFALICGLSAIPGASADPSVARVWDEEILAAIRIDLPNPPVHARNLFHFSVAMYDAWAAYDPVAVGYLYHDKHTAADVVAARKEAISYAAYRILRERYALSKNAATTLPALDARLAALGYDKTVVSQDPTTPAGLGNLVATTVSAYFFDDGARQAQGYADYPLNQGGYISVNPPLNVGAPGIFTKDINRWQPLRITNAVSQNGIPIPTDQIYVGAQWKGVRPFALTRDDPSALWIDPGPPPQLGGAGDALFRDSVVTMIRRSSELTPDDGAVLDISPGAFGNNNLGTNDGTGHPLNPVTGQPYAPNPVKRGDFTRVLAEFWADGPNSETPPGHWNVLFNSVSDHPSTTRQLGGTGPSLDPLEWDVKVYFALNAAVHDAACAAWSVKRQYDGWRPVCAVRYMGQAGQSSDPTKPSYHPDGLPLIPGLIELVTFDSAQPGQRHSGLPVGAVAILAWPGAPADPKVDHSGARWILPAAWIPYQKRTFVTPSFPGYISGHSTFSRAGAEVLAAATGSPFFPGGLGTFTANAGTFLTFEQGPSATVQLQWGTYYDAADQAGLSRIWGGIHPPADDFPGRRAGSQVGTSTWALATRYFDGTIAQAPVALNIASLSPTQCELRFPTQRGFFYTVQSATDPTAQFKSDEAGAFRAVDSTTVRFDSGFAPSKYFRVLSSLVP